MKKIATITGICDDFTFYQLQGTFEDGRNFYIRYKYGYLSIHVGDTSESNIVDNDYIIYEDKMDIDIPPKAKIKKIMKNLGFIFPLDEFDCVKHLSDNLDKYIKKTKKPSA